MRIVGKWFLCDDGITRPVVLAKVSISDGLPVTENFLVDTAADRTVLSGVKVCQVLPGRATRAGVHAPVRVAE